jgi:hypothetical protein
MPGAAIPERQNLVKARFDRIRRFYEIFTARETVFCAELLHEERVQMMDGLGGEKNLIALRNLLELPESHRA